VPQTQIALGVLGLLGLLLLAGSIVVAPFSALWIGLLLGLILIAGLLLFVVAFLPPALDAPPRPRTAAALPALPAERGWGDGSPPDLAAARPLIADLLERVLPGPPAPGRAGEAPADRALPAPPGVPPPPASATPPPPEVAVPSYVNQAFSDALERARHQWTFNLLVAFGTAGLIVVGIAISVTWVLSGEGTVWAVLLGPGATLVGVINWLLTRPAAQLSRADNQISLLSLVWTSYAQELRSCTAMPDPAAAAACTGRAGADAVNYFNAILSHPAEPPAS
jgi:hypothetical protein